MYGKAYTVATGRASAVSSDKCSDYGDYGVDSSGGVGVYTGTEYAGGVYDVDKSAGESCCDSGGCLVSSAGVSDDSATDTGEASGECDSAVVCDELVMNYAKVDECVGTVDADAAADCGVVYAYVDSVGSDGSESPSPTGSVAADMYLPSSNGPSQ